MKPIETERLLLRQWKPCDAEDLYSYARGANVGPMAGWKPHESIGESQKLIEAFIKADETWAIVYKKDNRVIGSIGLHHSEKKDSEYDLELGYAISEDYWGQGIATEAAREAVRFAFEQKKINTLIVTHFPFNEKSKNVIKKLGFVYLKKLEKTWKRYDGVVLDEMAYVMTKEQYLLLKKAKQI